MSRLALSSVLSLYVSRFGHAAVARFNCRFVLICLLFAEFKFIFAVAVLI